jgi:hypothetical protein
MSRFMERRRKCLGMYTTVEELRTSPSRLVKHHWRSWEEGLRRIHMTGAEIEDSIPD